MAQARYEPIMSQDFSLQLATETLSHDAEYLGVTTRQLQDISVFVNAIITKQPSPQLRLTYHICLPHTTLATRLDWSEWRRTQVRFTDYLWERTCLECFIAIATDTSANLCQTMGYIEINASPDGRYALYQFEGYRTPATMPPTPLLKAHVDWSDNRTKSSLTHTPPLSPISSLMAYYHLLPTLIFIPRYYYQRCFGVPLAQLAPDIAISCDLDDTSLQPYIYQLHPCVILWFGDIALYFAPRHASPPDFHQRGYWSRFEYNAAQAPLK